MQQARSQAHIEDLTDQLSSSTHALESCKKEIVSIHKQVDDNERTAEALRQQLQATDDTRQEVSLKLQEEQQNAAGLTAQLEALQGQLSSTMPARLAVARRRATYFPSSGFTNSAIAASPCWWIEARPPPRPSAW